MEAHHFTDIEAGGELLVFQNVVDDFEEEALAAPEGRRIGLILIRGFESGGEQIIMDSIKSWGSG